MWTVVHVAKLGSWSLLVVVSILLVAAVKAYEGRLYGAPSDLTVLRSYDAGPVPLPPQRRPTTVLEARRSLGLRVPGR